MASVLGNVVFGLVMMVVGGMIALLMIVWEMITHPRTVFKKVPRNGKSSVMSALHHSFGGPIASSPWTGLVHIESTCSLVPSPKRAWGQGC